MNAVTWIVLNSAVLITLLFSIAHYTLRNPSRVRLEQAFSGCRRRRWLKRLEQTTDELLVVTALMRMLSYLLVLTALVHVRPSDGWSGDLGSLAIAAMLVAVFGIGLPHAWAKYAGERTLVVLWPLLMVARHVLWPVSKLLAAMDLPVRRLAGAPEEINGRANEVEQEILQLVSEGAAGEGVDADELEMITSVIEFHDIRVSEIMTPRTDIKALPAASDRDECVRAVINEGHSRIPVYEDTLDSVVGVLYAKDLLGQAPDATFDLAKVMRKPFFVPETKELSSLLKEFRLQKVHMAIVLDEYGGTAGLVTIEDLIEEIVGEITDEYEEPEPSLFQRVDGQTVEVDARMYIDDLNDELPIDLPEEEDYDTVGGFVFSTLGYIPSAGEEFEYEGCTVTVLEAEQRRIKRVRIATAAAEPAVAEEQTE